MQRQIGMSRKTLIVFVVLVLLLLVGCDGSGGPVDDDEPTTVVTVGGDGTTTLATPPPSSSTSTTVVSDPIPGGGWVLVSGVPVVDGYPVTFSVDVDAFGGVSACNQYGGSFTRSDDTLTLLEFFQTDMACMDDGVMESEAAFTDALLSVTHWSVVDGQLHLEGPAVPLVFERVPEMPREALVDTLWALDTLLDGDVASSPVGDLALLLLSADGTVYGSTGCRTFTGKWIEMNYRIVFPNFILDGECTPDVAGQDDFVVNVLGDGFVPTVDGDVLTVTSVGNEALVYRASYD